MADQTQHCKLFLLLFLFSFLLVVQIQVHGAPQVPCYFIFGDALSDSGNNNNNLLSIGKANYPSYGVDFPEGPTGRFTDNRTVVDVITQLVGFDDFIPTFANARGREVLSGVNYASTGGGILDQTGRNLGGRISFNHQLINHLSTVSSIKLLMGNTTAADEYLNKCLYTVEFGIEDYVNNYFFPLIFDTSLIFSPEQFADLLFEQYTQQLKRLYSYGARKVAIIGLDVIGIAPAIIARFGANASATTNASQLFTNKLPGLVNQLNNQLSGANFTYINTTGIRLTSPELATLNATGTCCEVVDFIYLCVKGLPPCQNRSQYAFFDGYHPTDVVNVGQGRRAYAAALPTDSTPYDIRTLVQL